MKHNNVIPNGHFKKHWQNYVRTWFNQPARKTKRRIARQKKVVKTFPRPIAGPLRPIVHGQTLKYNMKVRAGRGFSLEVLKKPTIWVISSLLPIVGGVGLASMTDASFNWAGFWSAMASNLTNQSRNVLNKKFMVKKEESLDNITLFSIITIMSFILLAPVSIFMEGVNFTPSYFQSDGLNVSQVYTKSLLAALCFHAYQQEIWLDKRTGGVCLSISSKALSITGIDDRRYWNHIPTCESRFHTIAYLQQIWWLEVDGDFEFQFPTGAYSLLFRLQLGRVTKRLGRRVCNSENIHGWDIKPVQFQLTTPDGQHAVSRCFLDNLGNWVYYHVGDFVVEEPNASTRIKFSLTQIDCTHTKGGLCVDSVLICPSSLGKNFRSTL